MTEIDRLAQLAESLAKLEERIAGACVAAGRHRSEITLVAVTKTYPAADIATLVTLGIRDIGENRAAELEEKRAAIATTSSAEAGDPSAAGQERRMPSRWHFVGQIQRRQAATVARLADVVHSVDREIIVRRLGAAASEAGRVLDVLVQVSFDDDPDRGGISIAGVDELAESIARTAGLCLAGVMGVPPVGGDPVAAYGRLAEISAALQRAFPAATVISAGMSNDIEAAVSNGATHLRVGTALLGHRGPRLG